MSGGSGLVFVNFDGTGQGDDQATRKAVRSRATAYSHRIKPRKGLKAARYKPLDNTSAAAEPPQQAEEAGPSSKPAKRQQLETESAPAQACSFVAPVPIDDIGPSIPPSPAPSGTSTPSKRTSKDLSISRLLGSTTGPKIIFSPLLAYQDAQATRAAKRKRSHSPSPQPSAQYPTPNSDAPIPDLRFLDASSKDPFETYPVPRQPWYNGLMDNWYARLQHPRAYKILKCNPDDMRDYINYARSFEMTDPALFYIALLLGTGTPVSNGSLHVNKALWLRGQAVRAINEALCDPVRATSNALISAVGKMALHEHVYGDREAANKVHRAAQQQMIALRGGVEKLQLPRVVIHFMCWYDAYMAGESGTTAYFKDLPMRLKGVKSFTREEAVRVTDAASPNRRLHPRFGDDPAELQPSPQLAVVKPAAPR